MYFGLIELDFNLFCCLESSLGAKTAIQPQRHVRPADCVDPRRGRQWRDKLRTLESEYEKIVNTKQVDALERARLENRHATVTATLEAEVASLKRQLAASQEKLLASESRALHLEKCLGELEVARSMSLEALQQKWGACLEVAQSDASHKDQRVACLEAENDALVEEHVRLMRSIAVLADKGPVEAEVRERLDAPVEAGGGLLLAQLWRQNRDLQARLDAALNVSLGLQHE